MKKYLFTIIAMATALVACETEGPIEPVDPIETPEVAVSLSGSVPGLTRVSSDNAGIYKFQENDEITVITDNNTMRNFTAAQGAGETASFEGTIPQGESIVAAFYPASEYHTSSTFNVPTNILWKQDASNMPMFATVVTTQEEGKYSAEFKAVGGVLKLVCFNVPENATKMVFTAATQKIAGEFTITKDNNDNDQIVGSTSEVDNSITFDFTGNRSNNMVFYVPLPVVTLTGGFTIAFRNDTGELFSKTSSKAAVITRNKLLIAPALNCGTPAADATLTNSEMQDDLPTNAYGDGSITSTSGEWAFKNARYISNKMQIKKIADGGFLQLPSFGSSLSSITLYGVKNGGGNAYSGTVSLDANTTTSDNALASETVSNIDEGSIEISIPDSVKTNTGYLYSDGVIRFTSITVKFRDCDAPSISAGTDVITIDSGSKVATTSVILYNPVDDLGVSAILNDEAKVWVESAELSEGTLTITAKDYNSTQYDFTGALTLKATGAAYKTLNLVQKSAVVPNPDDLVAVAGNGSVTATWTKNEHAESYLAYLHTASTDTPAEGGESLTPTLSDGKYTITKDGLTNDQKYWLYVKVNEVEDNYVAPTVYVYTDFTPAEAKGTETNPYAASELYDLISGYDSGKGPEGTIYVKGYVSTANNPSSNYQTYFISDDGTTTKQFQAYRGKGISGADITSENRVNVGDWVVVSGTAINYSGTTPEFSAGSEIFTHNPKLAAPTFTPAADTYYSAQSVVISAAEGATIYYTTDETDPTTESTVYTEPIAVTGNMTLKAIAVKENFVTSAVATADYVIEAATKLDAPVINVDSFNHYSITFSWEAVENATGYQVSTNGGTDWSDTQEELTYTWTGLNAETKYTIYVKAIGTTSGQYTDSDAASKPQTTAAPKTLVSIALTTDPTQTTYNVNDTFSLAGAVVTATYSDESTADVTASCTTEYDFSTTGNKTVTISYTEGNITRTTTFNVTVAIVDKLSIATTGVTGTNYSSWSDKSKAAQSSGINSTAVYAGNSAGGNNTIQLRSNNSNSGIITTTSGGVVKKITVKWSSTTTDGRTLDIYGKNSAYSTAADLYGNNAGTLLGSIVKGTSTEVTVTGDYEFVGLRSNNGAMYIDEIDIEWETAATKYDVTIASGISNGTVSASVSRAKEGDVVTLTPTPATGYAFSAWDVYKTGDNTAKVTVSNNSFTMPAYGVTVSASFAAIPTISVTNPIEGVSADAGTYTIEDVYELLNGATRANVTVSNPTGDVTAVALGTADGSVDITVNANSGAARTAGTFNIKYGDEDARTITVKQLSGTSGPSDQSTNYKGNVTLSTSGGSNASTCSVTIGTQDYDGIKAGASKKVGAVAITVPSGTKYLHLHVAAWNGETVSLAVTPEGYSESISLTSDSGVSGIGSTFDVDDSKCPTDYYKVITFDDALTEDTQLTFTASGTNAKRFVIWGVYAE